MYNYTQQNVEKKDDRDDKNQKDLDFFALIKEQHDTHHNYQEKKLRNFKINRQHFIDVGISASTDYKQLKQKPGTSALIL